MLALQKILTGFIAIVTAIPWDKPFVWCLLSFVGGCTFDRSFMVHPTPAAAHVIPSPAPSPPKPWRLLDWVRPFKAAEESKSERPKEVWIDEKDGPQPLTEEEFEQFIADVKKQNVKPVADEPKPRWLPYDEARAELDAGAVVVVMVSADWCGSCPAAAKAVEKIAGDAVLTKLDVEDSRAKELEPRFLPAFFVYGPKAPTAVAIYGGDKVAEVEKRIRLAK